MDLKQLQLKQMRQPSTSCPSNTSSAGFSLLEVLVVVILVGVLAAIAAPGWSAFMNRQRLGRSGEQLLQAFRIAQSEAKKSSSNRQVIFENNPPRFAVVPLKAGNIPQKKEDITDWTILGEGNIKANFLTLTADNPGYIVFDQRGAVASDSQVVGNPDPPFRVTLTLNTNTSKKQCISVDSILGGLFQQSDNQCNP